MAAAYVDCDGDCGLAVVRFDARLEISRHAKRYDRRGRAGHGRDLSVFLYRPDGQRADDERCDSDADVLRFRIDFAYLFLFLGVCALLNHRYFHRQ